MVIEENKELLEENKVLKGRLRDTNLCDLVREASVATFASDEISDVDDEPAGQDEELQMADAPARSLPLFASGSTLISTPFKLPRTSGPNGFYPTPQSLPHAGTSTRPPPLSPSLGRGSFSSHTNPVVNMEVDETPIVADLSFGSNHEADLVYLAKMVDAPTSTIQSIEETYYARVSELKREGRETREKIMELTSAVDKEREEWKEEHSNLMKQLEQQKIRVVCLEDELAVCKVLLNQSRENEKLSAALSEEKSRLIQALSAVGTVKYQDEESHKNQWAKMLEERRIARAE
ncbi:hypothetical protein C0992_002043 [Termitomyces sp. T32_za158]|nr:hypothetical protein C0992_002043 [Termitomyces sp. T32_za158]